MKVKKVLCLSCFIVVSSISNSFFASDELGEVCVGNGNNQRAKKSGLISPSSSSLQKKQQKKIALIFGATKKHHGKRK